MRADKECPVWLRVTSGGKSRYRSTDVRVREKDWNPSKRVVRSNHPLATTLNDSLEKLRLRARALALEAATAEAVIAGLDGAQGSLSRYFEGFIGTLDERAQYWERRKYGTCLNKVQSFLGEDVDWSDIDPSTLKKFENFLRRECRNNPNTVRKELQRVKRVFRQAVADGELRPNDNPFERYRLPKGENPVRRWLSLEDIERLHRLNVEPHSNIAITRDIYVMSFTLGGARFGDCCRLKWRDFVNHRVEFRQMKSGRVVNITVPPMAQEVLARYRKASDSKEAFVFPFLRSLDESDSVRLRRRISSLNAVANREIKRACELAGLDPSGITMHTARHSFAVHARAKGGGNLFGIMAHMGHSRLQTTEQYLRSLDLDVADQLSDRLWGDH
jgi:integrase